MARHSLILLVLAHSAEKHGLVDQLGHSQLSCSKINQDGNCGFESNGYNIKGKTVLVLCHVVCITPVQRNGLDL